MKLRAHLYSRNIVRRRRLEVPVISVGNLTMGGSGKTPLVIYLAHLLGSRGYRPAVVSRGYRGRSRHPVNIVSDGTSTLMTAADAGDEPVLIASRLAKTVVATGRNRYRVGRAVVSSHHCDIVVLDDGFQHLGLERDIDLVLFDAAHFAGNSRVFPGGDLREPVSALQRCDAFILTGVSEDTLERARKCEELLASRFEDKPVFHFRRRYQRLQRCLITGSGVERTTVPLAGVDEALFAFSAIARAERFYRMAEEYGLQLVGRKSFRDHNPFSAADIDALHRLATRSGAAALLTTEKDMIKLSADHRCPLPFYVPILEFETNDRLDSFIIDTLSKRGAA